MATTGFGPYDLLTKLTITNVATGKTTPVPTDYRQSIINVIMQKTNMGASTVTLQLMDPKRILLNSIIKQGSTIEIGATATSPGQKFVLVQFVKASDQLQLVFEAECVYRLRNQRGLIKMAPGTNVTPFMRSLVEALNHKGSKYPTVKFVAPDYATIWSKITTGLTNNKISNVTLGRGTSTDPNEDSWTAMSRIASSIGWRLWEDNNTIYFGPDEWWRGTVTPNKQPAVNAAKSTTGKNMQTLQEFTQHVQLIDYDWDVGKPFAQATATAMLDGWNYNIGEIVQLKHMGPASENGGHWMISSMQREMFNVQASMGLTVPMPFAAVFEPTSLPLKGIPLG